MPIECMVEIKILKSCEQELSLELRVAYQILYNRHNFLKIRVTYVAEDQS